MWSCWWISTEFGTRNHRIVACGSSERSGAIDVVQFGDAATAGDQATVQAEGVEQGEVAEDQGRQ